MFTWKALCCFLLWFGSRLLRGEAQRAGPGPSGRGGHGPPISAVATGQIDLLREAAPGLAPAEGPTSPWQRHSDALWQRIQLQIRCVVFVFLDQALHCCFFLPLFCSMKSDQGPW